MKITVRTLCYMAMLVALNIILTRVFSFGIYFGGVEGIRIGFGMLPVVLAGLLLGCRHGFITGVIGDLIGFQLNPGGPYLPTFTLAAGLHGLLPGLLFHRVARQQVTMKIIVLIVAVNNVMLNIVVTPLLLDWHFGLPIVVTMPARVIAQLIIIPSMAVMVYILCKRLQQYGVRINGAGRYKSVHQSI